MANSMVRALCDCIGSCGQLTMLLIGYFTIFMACALISNVVYVYVHICLPAVASPGTPLYFGLLGGICWISFGVWFNYYMSISVHPGRVPKRFKEWFRYRVKQDPDTVPEAWVCKKCREGKPARSHHCSICGECVLKMDHHCPWINGCVGYHNQRYFFLFLVYLLVGTFYCSCLYGYVFWHQDEYKYIAKNIYVLLAFVVSAAIFIAMVAFVSWNGYLVKTNQTAIEFQINRDEADRVRKLQNGMDYRNPYDLGLRRNIAEVFNIRSLMVGVGEPGHEDMKGWKGSVMLLSALLPTIQPMHCDGSVFPQWSQNSNLDAV